ncbi:MAG: AraC family transcriptional regulator [Clostridiales bacterium]|jgi:AraC-like DNA-binding protein|nr:AraC family transcriptional regulator [Clostridiales bacterium]
MKKEDLFESLSVVHGSVNVAYGGLPSFFPNHWHGFLEIIVPDAGGLDITIDNKEYRLSEGQFALIPPRKLHSIANTLAAPQLIIQFSNDLLPRLNGSNSNRRMLYLQRVIDNGDFANCENKPLDILFKIKDYCESETPFKEFHLNRELLDLFIVLGEYNYKLNAALSARKNFQSQVSFEKFDSVIKYINDKCASKISLEEVASYAGFSKYHFSRIFKEYFETSFPEYVMKQRIKHAIEILENSDISILDAALLSGFNSHSSFNRVFKQVMHCAPSDFRKMFNCSGL